MGCTTLDTHFITLAGLPAAAQQALKALQSHIQEMLQVCMLAALRILMFLNFCWNTQDILVFIACTP